MAKQYSALERIDSNDPINAEHNAEFLYNLQHSLLLALKEQGRINETQYRHAAEQLRQQRCDQTRRLQNRGGGP